MGDEASSFIVRSVRHFATAHGSHIVRQVLLLSTVTFVREALDRGIVSPPPEKGESRKMGALTLLAMAGLFFAILILVEGLREQQQQQQQHHQHHHPPHGPPIPLAVPLAGRAEAGGREGETRGGDGLSLAPLLRSK